MDDDADLGVFRKNSDEFETKQTDTVRQRRIDREEAFELSELTVKVEGEGEDDDLTQLSQKLVLAKARHAKAEQDVKNPGWGRWVKYIFVTATENANTVESSDFKLARLALFGSVGIAGTAVSYLLPALDMSEIRNIDRATNTTSPSQTLTDHANVTYYWGNAVSLGVTSMATFVSGLAGIRKSYNAMRERILAQAALERDQAQANYDNHVKYTARLRKLQEQFEKVQKSRDDMLASVLQTGKKLESAQQREKELDTALNLTTAKFDTALQLSNKAATDEKLKADDLKSEIVSLRRELDEAKAEITSSRQGAGKLREAAAGLELELSKSKAEIDLQRMRIQTLEFETKTSENVILLLKDAITKIDLAGEKIETVSAKIGQLSDQAQSKVTGGPTDTKD